MNVYVIEHARGLVLFDLGQDRASVTDPDAYFPGQPTRFLYDRLPRFQIGPRETLTAQLTARGYAPSDVRVAVMSHLHEDHIGGIREIPGAELVVSRAEWATMEEPFPEPRGFMRQHIALPGRRFRKVDFEPTSDPALQPFDRAHDLMGDGSLLLGIFDHSLDVGRRADRQPPGLSAIAGGAEASSRSIAARPGWKSSCGRGGRRARRRMPRG